MRRIFLVLGAFLVGACLVHAQAAEPELSADEPITADFNSGDLVARGNARFEHPEFVIEADEIRFNQNSRVLVAIGNVRVTRVGLRLVTERLRFNVTTRQFEAGAFRAGAPPLFVEGASFAGTFEELEVQAARVYFREPTPMAPAINFDSAKIDSGERIQAEGVDLDLPLLFAVPLPSIDRRLSAPDLEFTGNFGYRSRLGGFIRTEILAPVNADFSLGGNLDLYSRRGVLLGPSLRYRREFGSSSTVAYVSSGWIADQGERGVDVQNEVIPIQRYFADLGFHHTLGPSELVIRSTFLSDSEVERDFRPSRFEARPHPNSFVEYNQLLGDTFVTVFVERSPNDFYRTVERVPEISFQAPLRPLGATGLLHGARASFARLRAFGEVEPGVPPEIWADAIALRELDSRWASHASGAYGLQYPFTLARWAQFTPVAQVQWDHWEGEIVDDLGGGGGQWTAALGLDLDLVAHGEWDTINQTWGIRGLRHVLRPLVRYRYFTSDATDPGSRFLPQFNTLRPELNLLARRDAVDFQYRHHLVRVGLRNVWQTEGPDGIVRELLELNLFHDWISEELGTGRQLGGTYVELATAPARWLRFSLEQKIEADQGELEELRVRLMLRSAEAWELELASDFLDSAYDQYRINGAYRVSPRSSLIGGWRYDARRSELTRQFYGVRLEVGRSWQLEAAIVFRSGAAREDDVTFQASVQLLEF